MLQAQSSTRRALVAAAVLTLVAGLGPMVGWASVAAAPNPEYGSTDWIQVAAGTTHTCGIRAPGRAYCWGSDAGGRLGNSGSNVDSPIPVEVAGGTTNWVRLSAGGTHTCGLRATGRVYCWGDDSYGQLGNGVGGDSTTPALVNTTITDFTSVAAGDGTTCGRRANGRLYCWGRDDAGQLGDNPTPLDAQTPKLVGGGFTDWTGVDVGITHACGVRANGRLYCWGADTEGELGNGPGSTSNRFTPSLVRGASTDWRSVAVGGTHTCARRATGRLYCWGRDDNGQLGDGPVLGDRTAPVAVGTATDWTMVDLGRFHTCARKRTGRLWCWGADSNGQLGNGLPLEASAVPAPVVGGDWLTVSLGGGHTCARTTTKRLFCWGTDGDGRLGTNGPDTSEPGPEQVDLV
jgi:alpha-tubulin suppressor-like RCC1 family protein